MQRKKFMNKSLSFQEVDNFGSTEDLYVCAMGFEERSLSSNIELQNKNFKAKTTFIIKYTNYVQENEKYRSDLEKITNAISENFAYIPFDTTNRDEFIQNFYTEFKSLNHSVNSITINISAMITFTMIWIINFALDNSKKIRIIYTEPEGYGNQLENNQSFSSGVKEIFTMKEFVGATLPGYSNLLITFLGYDFIRSRGIYEQLQPSKKIGIMAKPNTPKLFDLFSKMVSEHRNDYRSSDDLIKLSLFDLEGVITRLSDIRVNHIENSNIFIALNGTKLHHISALLFAKKFQDIQMILSSPLEYFPKNYSYGTRRTFELEITNEWLTKFLEN